MIKTDRLKQLRNKIENDFQDIKTRDAKIFTPNGLMQIFDNLIVESEQNDNNRMTKSNYRHSPFIPRF